MSIKAMYRGLRGGSWHSDQWYARCSYRNWLAPDYFYNNLGFRLARKSRKQE